MFSFKIETYECKHSNFRFWNFKIFCKVWLFFTMESSDGEGLWQPYLELVDANNIYSSKWASRCIKMLSIWKKMRKHFKTLLELKLKFIPKAWKWEAMAPQIPLQSCSLEIEILTRLFPVNYFSKNASP